MEQLRQSPELGKYPGCAALGGTRRQVSPKTPISKDGIFLSRNVEIVRFFLAGYTLQHIKFSPVSNERWAGRSKIKKPLQTGEKRLAAELLASQTRLERATPGLGGSCSIQLSYWDIYQKYSIFLRPRIRTNCRLGGERSILLSYRDLYEIELVTITFGFELIG